MSRSTNLKRRTAMPAAQEVGQAWLNRKNLSHKVFTSSIACGFVVIGACEDLMGGEKVDGLKPDAITYVVFVAKPSDSVDDVLIYYDWHLLPAAQRKQVEAAIQSAYHVKAPNRTSLTSRSNPSDSPQREPTLVGRL